MLIVEIKLESTVRYLGIETDDTLEMAEKTECRNSKRPAADVG